MSDLFRIPPPRFPDVRLRTPPNWTVIAFLAMLGAVHLGIAIPATFNGRGEGYLSFVCAALFLTAAIVGFWFRTDISIQTSRRQVRLRTGVGRWYFERIIPFDAVSAVRLTFDTPGGRHGRIDILCLAEEIEYPPSRVPRQEALFLAMVLGVTLIKVEEGGTYEPRPDQKREVRDKFKI